MQALNTIYATTQSLHTTLRVKHPPTIMMIIIIIKPIYNEKKAKSRKISKVEKTAKSSEIQPLER